MHRIQNKEMIFIFFTQNGALKLEKIKILCYTVFDSIRIEILKYQEQDKEAEQNRQIIKTKNSRREVTANETQKNNGLNP